ncbi:MAG: phosphocholine cytidylyltransferase family protein [Proteobacteria bacterium]|nr:phosphocholine cytidylyltransferase family protein [Pseudomonadota bacterium]
MGSSSHWTSTATEIGTAAEIGTALRSAGAERRALVLAAGVGRRLLPMTSERPKGLIEVRGVPLLWGILDGLKRAGIRQCVLVVGHRRELIQAAVESWRFDSMRIRWVVNEDFAATNTLHSVARAARELAGAPFVLVNGDLWARPEVFDRALTPRFVASGGPLRVGLTIAVDRRVRLDAEAMKVSVDTEGRVRRVSKQLALEHAAGESIGVYSFDTSSGACFLSRVLELAREGNAGAFYEAALDQLLQQGMVAHLVDVPARCWVEVDDHTDLARARRLASGRVLTRSAGGDLAHARAGP